MGARRKFTDEFKREAVKLATQPGVTTSAIARELGVERSVLSAWIRKVEEGRYESSPGKPLKSDSQAENERLRRELARVKMERDILKKALVRSTGLCNTNLKCSGGRSEAQGLSRAFIQPPGDTVQVCLRMRRQVGALRKILA